MRVFLGVLVGATLAALLFCVLPLIGALSGAFCGWVVGWFFSETVLTFLSFFGVKGLAMWQVGLALGFVGGFFKSVRFNDKS